MIGNFIVKFFSIDFDLILLIVRLFNSRLFVCLIKVDSELLFSLFISFCSMGLILLLLLGKIVIRCLIVEKCILLFFFRLIRLISFLFWGICLIVVSCIFFFKLFFVINLMIWKLLELLIFIFCRVWIWIWGFVFCYFGLNSFLNIIVLLLVMLIGYNVICNCRIVMNSKIFVLNFLLDGLVNFWKKSIFLWG